MENIKSQLLNIINRATYKVVQARGQELYSMIDPHPQFPHCEKFLVELVNELKVKLADAKINISKNQIISIYKRYEGEENANYLRVQRLLKH